MATNHQVCSSCGHAVVKIKPRIDAEDKEWLFKLLMKKGLPVSQSEVARIMHKSGRVSEFKLLCTRYGRHAVRDELEKMAKNHARHLYEDKQEPLSAIAEAVGVQSVATIHRWLREMNVKKNRLSL